MAGENRNMQGRNRRRTHRVGAASLRLQTASNQRHANQRLTLEPLEERRMLAGTPELLKDINATTEGSDPRYIGVLNDAIYFTTSAGELWKSDGSTAGTELVSDVSLADHFGSPLEGVELNGRLYFFTADYFTLDSRTFRLWETDGTTEGTVEVRAVPFSENTLPLELTATSDALFFLSGNDQVGRELWTSDGTAAGTHMVKDIAPGPAGSAIAWMVAVEDVVYFRADDGVHGAELWRSDGTEAGTQLVLDARPGAQGSGPHYLTNFDGKLMFVAGSLWTSDGTAAGTRSVSSVSVDGYSTAPFSFNGELYFAGRDNVRGSELWKSDGTLEGTVLVKEIDPEDDSSSPPRHFAAHDGFLYFQAKGSELWKTDGTGQGTSFIVDMPDPERGPFQTSFLVPLPWGGAGGKMLFLADDGVHGKEWWRVEESGVSLVADVQRNANRYDLIRGFDAELYGVRFFAANDGTHGQELWRTDGTEAGTFLLGDLNATTTPSTSDARNFIEVGDTTFFLAKDAYHGHELWQTDGTSAGTRLVKDVEPGARSSYIYGMANVGGTLLFSDSFQTGEESYSSALWRSDGTEEGTVLVYEFTGQGYSPWFDDAQVIDGVLYFNGWDAAAGRELWRSDGTAAGTWRVADIMPGASDSYPSDLTNVDGVLYFAAKVDSGYDLWKSDGTAAGTVRVKDLELNASSSIYRIFAAEGRLYFVESNRGSQFTLWTSDGSEEGTVSLGSIVSVRTYATVDGTLYFERYEGTVTRLFATDGTVAGTRPLREGASFRDLTNVNGTLYFASGGLWKTDGTVEGTVLVKTGGPGGVRPEYLRNVNGTLFFRSGDALWKSDGTEAGTVLVDDSLVVDNLYAVGNKLYILNHDPVIGMEPWVLHVPTQVVSRQLFYNDSAFDGGSAVANAAAANAADDGAIAPDKIAYLPGSGRSTTASVSSYVHGINGVMIDIAGLEGDLTADDFVFRVGTSASEPESWALAPAPLEIAVRAGAGANGSDRVTITWANGAIKNTWLQVTVKGNDAAGGFNTDTGLAGSDVFFFGSRVGDTFEGATAVSTATTSRDELAARFGIAAEQTLTSLFDFNRDGVVTAVDQLIARQNVGVLRMLEIDDLAVASAATSAPADSRFEMAFALAIGDNHESGEADSADFWWGAGRRLR